MAPDFVSGVQWLNPIMPSPSFPQGLLDAAERLPLQAGRLSGLLPVATAKCLAGLLRITSSYYSNLIEGQYTEPAELPAQAPRRSTKELNELAIGHIGAQEALERLARQSSGVLEWRDFFDPVFLGRIHRRLFEAGSEQELTLADGSRLVPGQLRDQAQRNVLVGNHAAPHWDSVMPMLHRLQDAYGRLADPRLKLLGCLAYHHRLSFVRPFTDGNGRVARLVTHLQLYRLGLVSPLWSLSRGLARHQDEYYARLRAADQPRRGDIDGRGLLSQAALIEFVEFMLQTCIDQMAYIEKQMGLTELRARLERVIALEPTFINAGIKPEMARALHILLTQGEVTRADFKIYTGLIDKTAGDQLKKLIGLGVVETASPKSRQLLPALPVWFAQLIFPDLHRRFYH
ncbi:MAG: Fic family protein [Pseudomonas sp.]